MATQTIDIRVVDKASVALKGIGQKLNGLNKGLLGVNRIAAVAGTALAAIGGGNLIKNIVTTTSRYEDLRTTLSSVTGSAMEGAKAFKFVSDFSTQTQFGVEELAVAYTKLKANGLEPNIQLLTTFTDAAAVTTDQLGSLTAITDFYTRSLQSQTVELTDLERLADRGLPVYDIIKEKLGIARSEISKFSKEAGNTEKIVKALGDGINERFGGATQARLENLSTRFSNLRIAIDNASDAVGRQGFGLALGEATQEITDLFTKNEAFIKQVGLKLTKAFLITKDAIKLVIGNVEFLGKAFIAFFALKVAVAFGALAFTIGSVLVKALVVASRAFAAFTAVMKANPIIRAATVIIAGVELLTGKISDMASELASIGGEAALDALENGFTALAPKVGLNVDAINEFKNGLATSDQRALELQNRMNELANESDKLPPKINETGDAITDAADKTKHLINGVEVTKKAFEDLGNVITETLTNQSSIDAAISKYNQLFRLIHEGISLEKQALEERDKLASDPTAQKAALANARSRIKDEIDAFVGMYDQKTALENEYNNQISEISYLLAQTKIGHLQLEVDEIAILNNAMVELERKKTKEIAEIQSAAIDERIRKELNASKSILASRLSAEDRSFLQAKGNKERQEQITNDRIEFEKKSTADQYQFGIQQAGEFFSALGSANKKAFEAAKAFNIANAIMNTYAGATKALATYPPPFNFIAAAAVVASGLAQVSAIRSQQYTGRQRGGALQIGQGTVVGEDGPEIIVPKQPGTVIPREVAEAMNGMDRGSENVIVNFNINTVDAEGFDDLLIQRRGTITGIINQALQKRGKQGVV